MKWNTEYFGFRLLVFVGFCGEVPVALLRKTGGCYDYRRRVVTELVRTGYLKERKFRGERRAALPVELHPRFAGAPRGNLLQTAPRLSQSFRRQFRKQ